MATVKGFGAKGAAAGAERGALNKDLQETLDLLKKSLEQDAKLAAGETIKGKTKPTFRSPEEAAKYWDKVYKELSTGATQGIYPIGPNAPRITYKKDGQLFTLDRDVKPPVGAERVSLTDADILKMMPPRPQVSPKAAGEPNAYGNPPPPEYTARMQPSPAVQEAIQTAKETVGAKAAPAPEMPFVSTGYRPSSASAGPAETYVPPGSRGPTVEAAREALAGQRGAVPNVDPRMKPNPPAPGPWGAKAQPTAEPSNLAVYGAPAAIGAGAVGTGIMYGSDPDATEAMLRKAFNVVTGGTDVVPNDRTDSPNHDIIPYMGPGVSEQPDDFRDSGIPFKQPVGVSYDNSDFAPNGGMNDVSITPPTPDQSGRELGPFPERQMGQEQRFRPELPFQATPNTPIYSGRELGSNTASQLARQVIQRAQNSPTAQAQQAAAVLQESPNQLTVQKGPEQGSNALVRFIRGDFSEGADQRVIEAMRRQREESGVDSGRAAGGAAPKKSNKDDVLHKALEIIHHMLTRR